MAIERISAPYSFVPLNSEVYIPTWYNKVSQDIPFEDGEDGIIELKWRNVSPLIIREGSTSGSEVAHSVSVAMPDGTRRYFIPGSSLKGMLRNVMSIMSFGKFNSFMDRQFGYRNISDSKYRNDKVGEVRHGWLQKQGNDYILYPCKGKAEKIEIEKVKKLYPKYDKEKSAWKRNEVIENNSFPEIRRDDYRLFATGKMDGKRHELLIPNDNEDEEYLDEKVWKSFFTVYEHTPDFDKYKEMLENGKEIPVGYIRDKDTKAVKVIGMGKMLRYPFMYSVADLVRNGQKEISQRDLCETIFGWVDKNDSMKGRVQMGNAFCEQVDDVEGEFVKGVLGEPRASYYPLYLEQDEKKGRHNTYDDATQISGWKRYRIHQGNSTCNLPKGNGNENVENKFKPLKPGLTFTMRISVHNLRKVEIGALLSAITFHHTEEVWHNIGGAKSFGYGKLACDYSSIKLRGLQYDKDEYLAAFEEEMNKFTQATIKQEWTSCDRMKTLVAIASEHSADKVLMMTLTEYGKTKNKTKSNQAFYLPWPENATRCLHSAFTDEYREKQRAEAANRKAEKVRSELSERYVLLDSLCTKETLDDLRQAKHLLEEILKHLQREGVNAESEQKRLDELEQKIANKQQEELKRREEEEREGFLNKGLAGLLNEKYPNKEEFKVDCWKTCASKLKKWMKETHEDGLTDEEKNVLAEVVCRLKNEPNKKEAKGWLQADSKIWKEVADLLSKERADKLFNNEERHD